MTEKSILKPGILAPDFTLPSESDKTISLSDYRGKRVILVFYPADWSPVCGEQLPLYNEILSEFRGFNAEIVAVSVDNVWSHMAFSKDMNLEFPLLSDFEPKGAVARTYGVYREQDGLCERALFVIDGEGIIRWSYLSPLTVNPGADGILKALEELNQE